MNSCIERRAPLERLLGEMVAELDDGAITVEEFVEHVLLYADSDSVAALVDRLTDRQQEVVLLKYLADFTTKEIMQLLNLSEDAVENQLRRARNVLRGKRR
jgi:RNA polymerase sigma factor (sigma-70 family)